MTMLSQTAGASFIGKVVSQEANESNWISYRASIELEAVPFNQVSISPIIDGSSLVLANSSIDLSGKTNICLIDAAEQSKPLSVSSIVSTPAPTGNTSVSWPTTTTGSGTLASGYSWPVTRDDSSSTAVSASVIHSSICLSGDGAKTFWVSHADWSATKPEKTTICWITNSQPFVPEVTNDYSLAKVGSVTLSKTGITAASGDICSFNFSPDGIYLCVTFFGTTSYQFVFAVYKLNVSFDLSKGMTLFSSCGHPSALNGIGPVSSSLGTYDLGGMALSPDGRTAWVTTGYSSALTYGRHILTRFSLTAPFDLSTLTGATNVFSYNGTSSVARNYISHPFITMDGKYLFVLYATGSNSILETFRIDGGSPVSLGTASLVSGSPLYAEVSWKKCLVLPQSGSTVYLFFLDSSYYYFRRYPIAATNYPCWKVDRLNFTYGSGNTPLTSKGFLLPNQPPKLKIATHASNSALAVVDDAVPEVFSEDSGWVLSADSAKLTKTLSADKKSCYSRFLRYQIIADEAAIRVTKLKIDMERSNHAD